MAILSRSRTRCTVGLVTLAIVPVWLLTGSLADAAVVPTVPMGTSSSYSVLAATSVTNTGNSRLSNSLGLWPGTSITGFPPGVVLPPGTTNQTNSAAEQAQFDFNVAYLNAAGRSVDTTTTADLANLVLAPGVHATTAKGALDLTGPLVLDGGGDVGAVFIFQTNSMLTTAANSTVTLINGAQECNVFWQVGSSATLGASSVFSGSILADTTVTAGDSVTIRGRTLARGGAVTLQNDTFTTPTCAQSLPTTTTTTPGATTTTTTPGATTTTTTPGATTTTTTPGATTTTLGATTTTLNGSAGANGGAGPNGSGDGTTSGGSSTSEGGGEGTPGGTPRISGPPFTGFAAAQGDDRLLSSLLVGGAALPIVVASVTIYRRRSRTSVATRTG